jgi:hypothetical protein
MAQKKIKVIVEDEFEAKKQEILKKLEALKGDAKIARIVDIEQIIKDIESL